MKKNIFCCLFLVFYTGNLFGQNSWEIKIDSLDSYNSIITGTELRDGGFVIGGWDGNLGFPFIIKLDSGGNVLWAKTYNDWSTINWQDYIIVPEVDSGFYFEIPEYFEDPPGVTWDTYSLYKFNKNGVPVSDSGEFSGQGAGINHVVGSLKSDIMTGSINEFKIIDNYDPNTGNYLGTDVFFEKLNRIGSFIYTLVESNSASIYSDYGKAKDVYSGSNRDATFFYGGNTLAKVDSAGYFIWQKQYKTLSGNWLSCSDIICVDSFYYAIVQNGMLKIDMNGSPVFYNVFDTTIVNSIYTNLIQGDSNHILIKGNNTFGRVITEMDFSGNITSSNEIPIANSIQIIDCGFSEMSKSLFAISIDSTHRFHVLKYNKTFCNSYALLQNNYTLNVTDTVVNTTMIHSLNSSLNTTMTDNYLFASASPICVVSSTNNYYLIDDRNIPIFPNPFKNEFTISGLQVYKFPFNLKMFDVYGREVISQKLTTSNPKLKTSNLFPGIYFVEIISDDGKRMIKKLIKE